MISTSRSWPISEESCHRRKVAAARIQGGRIGRERRLLQSAYQWRKARNKFREIPLTSIFFIEAGTFGISVERTVWSVSDVNAPLQSKAEAFFGPGQCDISLNVVFFNYVCGCVQTSEHCGAIQTSSFFDFSSLHFVWTIMTSLL